MKVRTLASGYYPAGLHHISWNGRDDRGNQLPGGIYLYRLGNDNQRLTKRMVLIR